MGPSVGSCTKMTAILVQSSDEVVVSFCSLATLSRFLSLFFRLSLLAKLFDAILSDANFGLMKRKIPMHSKQESKVDHRPSMLDLLVVS